MSNCPNCYSHITTNSSKCEECDAIIPYPRRTLKNIDKIEVKKVDGDTYKNDAVQNTNIELDYLLKYLKNNHEERAKCSNYNAARLGIDTETHVTKLILSLVVLLFALVNYFDDVAEDRLAGKGLRRAIIICEDGENFLTFGLFMTVGVLIALRWWQMRIEKKIWGITATKTESVLFVVMDYFSNFAFVVTFSMFIFSFVSTGVCEKFLDLFSAFPQISPLTFLYDGFNLFIIQALSSPKIFGAKSIVLLSLACTIYAVIYFIVRLVKGTPGSKAAAYFIVGALIMSYLVKEFDSQLLVLSFFASKAIERFWTFYILNIKDHKEADRKKRFRVEESKDQRRIEKLEVGIN